MAYYLQYCGSYAPHRRRRTLDTGRWTLDAGPSTPYYKLTGELKMDKTKQFNSLSFTFLFNQLQSTTLECCFARFLPVLKQNASIIAVKLS